MSQADGPTCQYCGEPFGNAGAKANHERACPHNPENAPDTAPQQGQAAAPPTRQPQGQGGPMTPAQGGGLGAGLADTLYVLRNFDEMPSDVRRETVSQATSIAGSALNRWLDLREADIQRQEEMAKNAQLEPADEFPTCPECDYQFDADDLGGDSVRCPSCDSLFNVTYLEPAAEA